MRWLMRCPVARIDKSSKVHIIESVNPATLERTICIVDIAEHRSPMIACSVSSAESDYPTMPQM